MDPDPLEAADRRELRLEGLGLAIVGGVLLALLFGAFQLGRAVERWSAPERTSTTADPPGNTEDDAVDATEKLTFFDTLSGPGKEAEPGRQARPATLAPAPAAAAAASAAGRYRRSGSPRSSARATVCRAHAP